MCVFCLLHYIGDMAFQGAANACGARQGEYTVAEPEPTKPKMKQLKSKGRDWRSYLCCKFIQRVQIINVEILLICKI